ALSENQDRLPKGPRSASGSLDADTPSGPVFKLTHLAEGTEDAEESKTIPLMNADDTDRRNVMGMNADGHGLENGSRSVEWRPSAEIFRSDTRDGMEAYEASFRMKIAPRLNGERRPLQQGIAPDDLAQVHANLG